ncbi:hypothetical protein [Thermoflavimicrobium daqui]|uniref:Uncharacterized protein n=1 Tax=Thermoflavimicrobium daqui TaxID=2137476 RepID=A0A364K513_9BACL|nr:hypothetical protein [Thermoflavimicrobium daqui]RAL24465.1 hypothetical protein DL897_09100 [Thermoflavimicrobium daqui]
MNQINDASFIEIHRKYTNYVRMKKWLRTFECIFSKHAEICLACNALIVWPIGEVRPEKCRQCRKMVHENI